MIGTTVATLDAAARAARPGRPRGAHRNAHGCEVSWWVTQPALRSRAVSWWWLLPARPRRAH